MASLTARLRAACGLAFLGSLFCLCTLSCYIGYIGVFHGNVLCLSLFVALMTYQTFFARKSERAIRFMRWFHPENYFHSWTYVSEDGPDFAPDHAMLSLHPHCFCAMGFLNNLYYNVHGMTPMSSRFAFNLPVFGLFSRLYGTIPISPDYFHKSCKQGRNITFVPGGFEEATITSFYEDRVYINKRKGFIKYALQYGYKVYPAYVFNEHKCFYVVEGLLKLRLLLNKIKMVGVIPIPLYGLFPRPNSDVNTVVGSAIQMPKIDNPTPKDVEQYHQLYIQKLKELFYRHRDKYSPGAELHIY